MNRSCITLTAIAFATLAGSAMADTVIPSWGAVRTMGSAGLTRQEVKAQTLEAIRSGNTLAAGEFGGSVRAQHPGQFPAAAAPVSLATGQAAHDMMAGTDTPAVQLLY